MGVRCTSIIKSMTKLLHPDPPEGYSSQSWLMVHLGGSSTFKVKYLKVYEQEIAL